jgi:hypothetical protein
MRINQSKVSAPDGLSGYAYFWWLMPQFKIRYTCVFRFRISEQRQFSRTSGWRHLVRTDDGFNTNVFPWDWSRVMYRDGRHGFVLRSWKTNVN